VTKLARAAAAFEDFTGHKPTKVRRSRLDDKTVASWALGPAVGIAYEAVRDGKRSQYFHEFAKSARPMLASRDDGRQLYLSGGNYTVTNRGIEDNMPDMFTVNPSSRGGSKRTAMAAAKRNSKGRFVKNPGGRRASTSRKRRPAAKRRRSTQVAIFRGNPAAKRRRPRAAAKSRRRTYKRNPSGRGMMKSLGMLLIPAAGIGAGAVFTEILMGYLPIPAIAKNGVWRQVTKGALGIAAGWMVANFLKQKRLGEYIMLGAVVIAVHDGLKELMAAHASGVKADFGQYRGPLAHQFAGARSRGGGVGYISPAATTRMGRYVKPLKRQFAGMGGDAPIFARPGGETNFIY
jgi:hypothetical protein